jgi:hypothetical protein
MRRTPAIRRTFFRAAGNADAPLGTREGEIVRHDRLAAAANQSPAAPVASTPTR